MSGQENHQKNKNTPIRITSYNLVEEFNKCCKVFDENKQIIIISEEKYIPQGCTLAEMIKRKFPNIHQINQINTENRRVSMIIKLDTEEVNKTHEGYQAPQEYGEFNMKLFEDEEDDDIDSEDEQIFIKNQSPLDETETLDFKKFEFKLSNHVPFIHSVNQCLLMLLSKENPTNYIIISAAGQAIPQACYLAQLLKLKVKNLHQVNELRQTKSVSRSNTDSFNKHTIKFPAIKIVLTKNNPTKFLDHCGYQGPIDQKDVKEIFYEEVVKNEQKYQQENKNQQKNQSKPFNSKQYPRRRQQRRVIIHKARDYGNRGNNQNQQPVQKSYINQHKSQGRTYGNYTSENRQGNRNQNENQAKIQNTVRDGQRRQRKGEFKRPQNIKGQINSNTQNYQGKQERNENENWK